MSKAIMNTLKKASQGLLYQSETDEPFTAFLWGKAEGELTKKELRALAKHEAGSPIEETPFHDFFHDLTEPADWHGPQEKAAVKKYRRLQETLQEQLSDLKVYKIGDTEKDVYIVGKTPEGAWAGLKTRAVET